MSDNDRYPTTEEFQRTYRWRRFWGIAAITSGGLLLFFFFATPIFLYDFLLKRPEITRGLYAAFLVAVIAFIYALHKWSIHVVSRLYLQVRCDRKSPDEDLLGNEPCYYCGAAHAPIVCGRCDSIQWPGLDHEATGIKDKKTYWATGVFIAHHRFKLLAAVLSALLLGVFPFVYRLEQERVIQQEEDALRKQILLSDLNEALPDLTSSRASLLFMASHCSKVPQGEALDNNSAYCSERFDLFFDHYFNFSWRGPQIIAQVRNEHCNKPCDALGWDNDPQDCVCITQNKACKQLEEHLVDELDTLFVEYLREHRATTRSVGEDDRIQICENRIEAARKLYHSGKRVSCAIVLAGAPLFGENLSSHESCLRALGIQCPAEVTVSKDQDHDQGDDGDRLRNSWKAWMAECKS